MEFRINTKMDKTNMKNIIIKKPKKKIANTNPLSSKFNSNYNSRSNSVFNDEN
jgi:hypothetical protein